MNATTIFTLALDVLFVACAIQLARIARARGLPNLYWLAANFAFAALGGFSVLVTTHPLPNILGLILSSLCTVMFIQLTFYRDRSSPYLFVIALIVVLGLVQVWNTFSPIPGLTLTFLGYTLVWGWQAVLAYQARRRLAHDRTIEDWVKARYRLWMSYTLLMFILSARYLIPLPVAAWERNGIITLVIGAGLLQFLTWAMPEAFRKYLNRNYQPLVPEDARSFMDMSEDELLQHVKI